MDEVVGQTASGVEDMSRRRLLKNIAVGAGLLMFGDGTLRGVTAGWEYLGARIDAARLADKTGEWSVISEEAIEGNRQLATKAYGDLLPESGKAQERTGRLWLHGVYHYGVGMVEAIGGGFLISRGLRGKSGQEAVKGKEASASS